MRSWKAKDGFQPLAGAFCVNGDEGCLSAAAELSVNAAYAYRGLYQAQRNLAYCLDSGCSGAITPNLQLSCAWRIVVLASAHVDADDTDIMNLQICLRKSNPMQIAAAKAQAARLFKVVYNKEISRDWR
ncbi:hypothetical protein BJF95_00865 [Rhizobium oryziradicis]|uniref:Uncharacterized protein n=2 Tax=Rhizobium oryziradicis TaxID=1867956 RepID=A0A1Q8ZMC0_9HYPH|nr:hypothetical protein BJF95_00865 [Rhizobium oryziradicis]